MCRESGESVRFSNPAGSACVVLSKTRPAGNNLRTSFAFLILCRANTCTLSTARNNRFAVFVRNDGRYLAQLGFGPPGSPGSLEDSLGRRFSFSTSALGGSQSRQQKPLRARSFCLSVVASFDPSAVAGNPSPKDWLLSYQP